MQDSAITACWRDNCLAHYFSGRSARLAASLIIFTALANGGAKAESHQSFANWKAELRVEALAKGISAQTFDTAFVGVKPIERVIELDRSQPEFTLTLETYLNKVVSATRSEKSRQKLVEHRAILKSFRRIRRTAALYCCVVGD